MKKTILLTACLAGFFLANAQTSFNDTIQVGALKRDFRVYLPKAYNGSKAVPLMLNLHGYGSNAVEQENYGDFRKIADTANFIIVHANGTFDNQGSRHWGTLLAGPHADDVGFLSALIDTISARYLINSDAVYSVGMSNGGNMSHLLACKLSNKIAAIASVTGFMSSTERNTCAAKHPMPVLQIHGTADNTIAYNGVSGIALPVEQLVSYWANFNKCNTTATVNTIANTNTADNCTAEQRIFENGQNGVTVEFFKVTNGGHTWPGSAITTGTTNRDFNASREIWRFLSKYRLSNVTSLNEIKEIDKVTVYPNPFENELNISTSSTDVVIELYDNTGRLIELPQATKNAGKTTLVLGNIPRGAYLLKLKIDGRITSQLLIK